MFSRSLTKVVCSPEKVFILSQKQFPSRPFRLHTQSQMQIHNTIMHKYTNFLEWQDFFPASSSMSSLPLVSRMQSCSTLSPLQGHSKQVLIAAKRHKDPKYKRLKSEHPPKKKFFQQNSTQRTNTGLKTGAVHLSTHTCPAASQRFSCCFFRLD